jgi:hypothetical protein
LALIRTTAPVHSTPQPAGVTQDYTRFLCGGNPRFTWSLTREVQEFIEFDAIELALIYVSNSTTNTTGTLEWGGAHSGGFIAIIIFILFCYAHRSDLNYKHTY